MEGYAADNGWAIGDERADGDPEAQDDADAEALYTLIETEMLPLFYERDEHGLPRRWLRRIRASMKTLLPFFNTHRMVKEYAERIYLGGGS